MKNHLFFISILFIASFSLMAQTSNDDFVPNGSPIFKVFWNYNYNFTPNVTKKSAFELERSYLGYKYNFSEKTSATVVFDAGSNSGGSSYTAFLKTAQLDWKVASGVKLSMGLVGLKQYDDQEGFWGYRYTFKSFNDANAFGTSADLGVIAEFTLSKKLTANFIVVNGEGYKNIQDVNGNQRVGGSLIFTPVKGLITKLYVDNQATTGSKAVTSLALFAGYQAAQWRLGVEYNKLNNGKSFIDPAVDHRLDGFSVYSTYVINNKFEVFGRFDHLQSNTLVGDTSHWNSAKDGNQIISGLQYAPVRGVKFALNYQGFNYHNPALDNQSKVFINAEFKL